MSDFLLYHKKTRPTGKAIASALGIQHGADPALIPADVTKVIRWGNAKSIRQGIEVINSGKSIMHAGDKLETLKTLQEKNVSCLEFYEQIPQVDPFGIYFARKRRGFGGKDITIWWDGILWQADMRSRVDPRDTAAKLAEADFFTKWVDNSREYRIHVVNGEIVRYQRKYRIGGRPIEHEIRVQNHSNGYVFKQPGKELNADRYETAKEAVAAVGLAFGAVDMVVTPSDRQHRHGKSIVLEINTAPSCSPKTIDAYVNAFKEVVNV